MLGTQQAVRLSTNDIFCCQYANTTSTKIEGYTGSAATSTALFVDTVATNKHFLLLMLVMLVFH